MKAYCLHMFDPNDAENDGEHMIHGFAKESGARYLLGFHEAAPIFEGVPGAVLSLVEQTAEAPVVGYSVTKIGERHGFLFYPNELSRANATLELFKTTFGDLYHCIPLSLL